MGTHGNNGFGALGKPNGNMGTRLRRPPEGAWETQWEHGNWEHALLARPLGNTNWESKPLSDTSAGPETLWGQRGV